MWPYVYRFDECLACVDARRVSVVGNTLCCSAETELSSDQRFFCVVSLLSSVVVSYHQQVIFSVCGSVNASNNYKKGGEGTTSDTLREENNDIL